MTRQIIDLTGRVFGRLTALKIVDGSRPIRWWCRCGCGKAMFSVLGGNLRSGNTLSCECLGKEWLAKHNKGMKYTEEERLAAFWEKVDRRLVDECWPWLAGKDRKGYAKFHIGNRSVNASRFMLKIKLGRELIPGEQALHRCDNPGCVNPQHLFVGTNDDNIRDKIAKGRQARGGPGKYAAKGAAHPMAKLSEAQIRSIRQRLSNGEQPVELARDLSVSRQLIYQIRHGKIWRHLQ